MQAIALAACSECLWTSESAKPQTSWNANLSHATCSVMQAAHINRSSLRLTELSPHIKPKLPANKLRQRDHLTHPIHPHQLVC
jgi:hypothetical protein